MSHNILRFERLSGDDEKSSTSFISVSRRARICARLDVFFHRRRTFLRLALFSLWVVGTCSTGAILVVASHSQHRLSYVPVIATGCALAVMLPLLIVWRSRREDGRAAKPEEVAALRELILPRHWKAIFAANEASYGRSSDRLATIGEILGWLDRAEAATKLRNPVHLEAIAAQRRAFGD